MDCREASEKITDLVLNRLDDRSRAELEGHIASCSDCREEYEHAKWLAGSVRRHRESLDEGHVASQLLYEYASKAPAVSGEREWVEAHVAMCTDCRKELETIHELFDLDISPPAAKRSWLTRLRERLKTGWVLIPAAAAVVLIGLVVLRQDGGDLHLTTPQQIKSTGRVVDLPFRLITRFGEQDSTVVIAAGVSAVLRVDLRHVDGLADRYNVRVVGPDEKTLLNSELSPATIAAGEAYITADAGRLANRTLRFELIAVDDGATELLGSTTFVLRP